ncbi:MAG: glycine cleavage system protein GcvH [Proteobacteria bacterium]|nr:MAG: glycine cleavage system protein GcvH [Pseudomonadota bacterium]
MEFPSELKYTKEHEWVRIEGGTATVGITEFAQSELGEVVFVDLPAAGKEASQGKGFCVVESTKAASDVYAPISGKVREVNLQLSTNPELINSSPYKDGWIARFENVNQAEIAALMDAEQYKEFLGDKVE